MNNMDKKYDDNSKDGAELEQMLTTDQENKK